MNNSISIITAIYNQLAMNKIFWEYLIRYTTMTFELIVIDNGSTDGSREFFEKLAKTHDITVISNGDNYSYPHCQNQGIKIAKYDILAFLNNDILVSPKWDLRIAQCIGINGFEVLSLSSTDRMYDKKVTKALQHKWKRIKYPLRTLFGQKLFSLRLMKCMCFGNWEKYCENIYDKYGNSLTYGFSGSAIIMSRKAIEIFGGWDITQQGADFDMMMRTLIRYKAEGDVKPCAIVNGIFHHHFRRVSAKAVYPPFVDRDNLVSFENKWVDSPKMKQRCFDIVKFMDIECGVDFDSDYSLKLPDEI